MRDSGLITRRSLFKNPAPQLESRSGPTKDEDLNLFCLRAEVRVLQCHLDARVAHLLFNHPECNTVRILQTAKFRKSHTGLRLPCHGPSGDL
jgi:hypothetical protein